MIANIKKKTKSFSHFIWLTLLVIITIFVTYFFENNKKSQKQYLKKTLENVYFQKTITKITSELESRYKEYDYIVKIGDTYESIINDVNISKNEKKIFLQTIKKK